MNETLSFAGLLRTIVPTVSAQIDSQLQQLFQPAICVQALGGAADPGTDLRDDGRNLILNSGKKVLRRLFAMRRVLGTSLGRRDDE